MVDGTDGIDNAFGKNLLPLLRLLYDHASATTTGFSYLALEADGRGTLYIGKSQGIVFVIPLVCSVNGGVTRDANGNLVLGSGNADVIRVSDDRAYGIGISATSTVAQVPAGRMADIRCPIGDRSALSCGGPHARDGSVRSSRPSPLAESAVLRDGIRFSRLD